MKLSFGNKNVLKSESHWDKFTGIFDMKGVPIHNGDDILVHDTTRNEPVKGKVGWGSGTYHYVGDHWCKYNIYMWRDCIEVIGSKNESIYYNYSTVDFIFEEWSQKNSTLLLNEREKMKKIFLEAFNLGLQNRNIKDQADTWLPIEEYNEQFLENCKLNCFCLFDNGEVYRYFDEHPFAELTHFKPII